MANQIGRCMGMFVLMCSLSAYAEDGYNNQALSSFREQPEKYWDFEKLKVPPKYRVANFPDSEV